MTEHKPTQYKIAVRTIITQVGYWLHWKLGYFAAKVGRSRDYVYYRALRFAVSHPDFEAYLSTDLEPEKEIGEL